MNTRGKKREKNTSDKQSETLSQWRQKKTIRRLVSELGLGMWIMIILLLIVGSLFIFDIENISKDMVLKHGIIGVFLFALITDLLILPVGADVPLILGILLPELNNFPALLLVLCASYIALTISYFVGRTAGIEGLKLLLSKKMMRQITKMRKYKKYERWGLFLTSITPLPYIPYLSGVFKFSLLEVLKFIVFPRTMRYLIVFTLTITLGSQVLNFI